MVFHRLAEVSGAVAEGVSERQGEPLSGNFIGQPHRPSKNLGAPAPTLSGGLTAPPSRER